MKILIAGDTSTKANKELVDREYSRALLAPLKPVLEAADVRLVNVESVLREEDCGAPIRKSGPNIYGAPKNIAFFEEFGTDCAVLANNHFGDFGGEAIESTLSILDGAKIPHIGGGRNTSEAYASWIAEKDGVRVSFLAVCENEFGCATRQTAGAAGFSLKTLRDRITEEKEKADFVIVIFHGGCEYNPVPSPDTVDRYHLILDLGADALVAMHTHCMQGAEYYDGKPILYSLGNFFFKWTRDETTEGNPWFYGYMASLEVIKGKGITYSLIPYRLIDDGSRFELFEGEKKQAMDAYLAKLSAVLGDRALIERYFDGWSAYWGVKYAKGLIYSPAFEAPPDDDTAKKLAALKNLFSCEAHNSLMKTLLRIEHEGRMAEALKAKEEILALQKMPF